MPDPEDITQSSPEYATEANLSEAFDHLFCQRENTEYTREGGVRLWADLIPILPILTRDEIREAELERLQAILDYPNGRNIVRGIAIVKRKEAGLPPLDDDTDVLTHDETIEVFVKSRQKIQDEYVHELRYRLSDTQLTQLADVLRKIGIVATDASIHTMQIRIIRNEGNNAEYHLSLEVRQTFNPELYPLISQHYKNYLAQPLSISIYRFTGRDPGEPSSTFTSSSSVSCPREISNPDVEACDFEQFREEERRLREALMKCRKAAVEKPRKEPFTIADIELIETVREFLSSVPMD